jgi:Domain of Unknown Function (DUF928)
MKRLNLILFTLLLTITTLPLNLSNLNHPTAPTIAQARRKPTAPKPKPKPKPKRKRLSWRTYPRPSRNRIGAYSRSRSINATTLNIFAPEIYKEIENIDPKVADPINYTLSSHPTVWVNITNPPKRSRIVSFKLKEHNDQQEIIIYQRDNKNEQFGTEGKSGLIGIEIPKTTAGLETGKVYEWEMVFVDDPASQRPIYLPVGGMIQRLSPDEITAKITASPEVDVKKTIEELGNVPDENKPALYAQLGIWYDALDVLIRLRHQNPRDKDNQEDWNKLLIQSKMFTEDKMKEFESLRVVKIQ